jgi:hypothetical protein
VYRKRLLLVSLMVVMLFSLFSFVPSVTANSSSWIDAIRVGDESELRNAINSAPSGVSVAIALNNNVKLTEPLRIPNDKNITLASYSPLEIFKLVGVADKSTIIVEHKGCLVLDGIAVTHNSGDFGNGVFVDSSGTLIMVKGEICGNSVSGDGGGVAVCNASFRMSGGYIYNNTASNSSGGVYISGSSFSVSGGDITHNKANLGGGVYTDGDFTIRGSISRNTAVNGGGVYNKGNFSLYGGTIYSNKASEYGGGVYTVGDFTMLDGQIGSNCAMKQGGGVYLGYGSFRVSGGKIWDNTANSGGGIWVDAENLGNLFVSDDVKFFYNYALVTCNRDSVFDDVYHSNIGHNIIWSAACTQGYNNYDIGYTPSNWFLSNCYTLLVLFLFGLLIGAFTYVFFVCFKNRCKQLKNPIGSMCYVLLFSCFFGGYALVFSFMMILQNAFGWQHMWTGFLIMALIGIGLLITGLIILKEHYLRDKPDKTRYSSKT